MALFRRLFYRKPPDRLLEIADRVYGNPTRLLLLLQNAGGICCREFTGDMELVAILLLVFYS